MSLLLLFNGAAEEAPSPRVVIGPGQGRQHQNGLITLGSSLLLTALATASMPFVNDTASYAASLQRPHQNVILMGARAVNPETPVVESAIPVGGRTPFLSVERKFNLNDTTTRNLSTGTLDFHAIASAQCEWPRNVEPRRGLTDTSSGMPQALRAVAAVVPPFIPAQTLAVQPLPQIGLAACQAGLNASLDSNATRIIGQAAPTIAPQIRPINDDTSAGIPQALLPVSDALPPGLNAPFYSVQLRNINADTSAGVPFAFLPVPDPLPVGDRSPFYAVQYRSIPNDTTVRNLNTSTLAAPPAVDVSMSFYHPLDSAGALSGGSSVEAEVCLTVSSGFPGTDVYPVVGQGLLRTGAQGGTAKLQFRAEVAGVVTAKEGMTLIVEKVA